MRIVQMVSVAEEAGAFGSPPITISLLRTPASIQRSMINSIKVHRVPTVLARDEFRMARATNKCISNLDSGLIGLESGVCAHSARSVCLIVHE